MVKKLEGTFTDRWIYTGLDDPQYIEDRNEFFRKNGNGWWFNTGKSVTTNKGNRETRKK